jgi:hypothetical protein
MASSIAVFPELFWPIKTVVSPRSKSSDLIERKFSMRIRVKRISQLCQYSMVQLAGLKPAQPFRAEGSWSGLV